MEQDRQPRTIWQKFHSKSLVDYINFVASFFERGAIRWMPKSNKPQIFITGLPRAGTTLIYQYLVNRLKVAYLTNGVRDYWKSPALVSVAQHYLPGKYQSNFESHYGHTSGMKAPFEGGNLWMRYFHIDNYVSYNELPFTKIRQLQNTVRTLQMGFGNLIFVNKDVKHQLRIQALHQIFPDSCFVIVERDLQSIALSLYRARMKYADSDWFSVKPTNYRSIKHLPLHEQVAQQVIALNEKLNADIDALPPHKIVHARYNEFCDNPDGLIERIESIVGVIDKRNPPMDNFERNINQPTSDDEQQLVTYLESIYQTHRNLLDR